MDLSLRRDECATEEEDESSKGEDGSGYELDVGFHCGDILKSSANMPTKMTILQIFYQKSFPICVQLVAEGLPSVAEEGFDVSFCYGLSEAVQEDEEVLGWDVLAGSMVEALMYFLGCHTCFDLEDSSMMMRLRGSVISRSWTDIGTAMDRFFFGL